MIEPLPSSFMCGAHGLRGEELVAEVHVERVVPVLDSVTSSILCRSSLAALLTRTPIGPSVSPVLAIARLEAVDVGEVAALMKSAAGLVGERVALVLEDIDEGDLRVVGGEGADDVGADAGRTAGHEDDPAREAGVSRERTFRRTPRSAAASPGRTGRRGSCRRRASSARPSSAPRRARSGRPLRGRRCGSTAMVSAPVGSTTSTGAVKVAMPGLVVDVRRCSGSDARAGCRGPPAVAGRALRRRRCGAAALATPPSASGKLTEVLPSALPISALMKFIEGEPMKPATKILAGRL